MLDVLVKNHQLVQALFVVFLIVGTFSLKSKNYTVFSLCGFGAFASLVLWFLGKL
jgi:hypothetical protein